MSDGGQITPDTNVSLPLWRLVVVAGLIVSAAAAAATGYQSLQWNIRALGERIVAVDAKLGNYDPGAVRQAAKDVVREALDSLVIECPRQVRRGEAVGTCHVVMVRGRKE